MEWTFENNEAICNKKCPRQENRRTIIIKDNAMNKIKILTRQVRNIEWMAMLQGKEEKDGTIIIEEITIPEQIGQKSHIELTAEGDKEAQETENIGWIHSHNTMETFFSKNDIQTASQNKVSIVTNNKLEMTAKVLETLPCGEKALIEAEVETETKEDNKLIQIIKNKIREKAEIITYQIQERLPTTGQTKLATIETRPQGMSRKEWKQRKRLERLEELEGIQTGWTGTCSHCQSKIKEYEETVFKNGRLYHIECIIHKEGTEWEEYITEPYH